MKFTNFKGTVPKLAISELPEGNATVATNTRLRSGAIEPYNDYLISSVTLNKTGVTTTIYPFDKEQQAGGPYWFNWTTSDTAADSKRVDVVRTPIVSDTTLRTIFTGALDSIGSTLAQPKLTNLSLATTAAGGQSTGYPYNWLLLGVPAPGTFDNTVNPAQGLIVTQTIDPTVFPQTMISDGSDLSNWTGTANTSYSSVSVSTTVGNPEPSFDLRTIVPASSTNQTLTYIYQNIQAFTGPGILQFDVELATTDTTSNYESGIFVVFGADENGNNGSVLQIPITKTTTTYTPGVTFAASNGWGNTGGTIVAGQASTVKFLAGQFYTVMLSYQPAAGNLGVYVVNMTIISAGATVFSGTFNNIPVSGGGYFGFSAVYGTNPGVQQDLYIDNIYLQQAIIADNPAYEATSWTYTYVNSLGQEGPPAPTSAIYYIGPGLITTLSNFDNSPTPGYGVTQIYLYRAVTSTEATEFQYEATLPIPTTTYVDTLTDEELGEVMSTLDYDLPPPDGRNVITLANGITLMSSGNTVCPSVAFLPYAYPTEYRLATDYPVVAMCGIETTAVVMTADSIYAVTGSDPSAMSMDRITAAYGCVSKLSAIRWSNYGVVFASDQGLVICSQAGAKLVTEDYITKREWSALYNPTTIEGAIYEDMYYGFYTNPTTGLRNCFIFSLGDSSVGFININSTTINPLATYTDHYKETLYVGNSPQLAMWDQGSPLPTTWRTKNYILPYATTFGAAQVQGNFPTLIPTLSMYKNTSANRTGTLYFTTTPTSDLEFVTAPDECFEIQVQISTPANNQAIVDAFQIGQTMDDLT